MTKTGKPHLTASFLLAATTLISMLVVMAVTRSGHGQDSGKLPLLRRGSSGAQPFVVAPASASTSIYIPDATISDPLPFLTSELERRSLQQNVSDDDNIVNNNNTDAVVVCDLNDCKASFEAELCLDRVEEKGALESFPMAVNILLLLILLSFSALFSGLTLGLMSLDITGLEIVMAGDDPDAAKYAKNIYPLRKKGNLLLCTLLLGNVAVNSLMSIFSATIFDGTIGFLSSTFLIVIFGEIIPQALVRIVLYCILLYYTVLYYTVFYCIALYPIEITNLICCCDFLSNAPANPCLLLLNSVLGTHYESEALASRRSR